MNLTKIYIIDNNFDFKLIIFYNLYNRASILVLTKVSTYSIILKSLALIIIIINPLLSSNSYSTTTSLIYKVNLTIYIWIYIAR